MTSVRTNLRSLSLGGLLLAVVCHASGCRPKVEGAETEAASRAQGGSAASRFYTCATRGDFLDPQKNMRTEWRYTLPQAFNNNSASVRLDIANEDQGHFTSKTLTKVTSANKRADDVDTSALWRFNETRTDASGKSTVWRTIDLRLVTNTAKPTVTVKHYLPGGRDGVPDISTLPASGYCTPHNAVASAPSQGSQAGGVPVAPVTKAAYLCTTKAFVGTNSCYEYSTGVASFNSESVNLDVTLFRGTSCNDPSRRKEAGTPWRVRLERQRLASDPHKLYWMYVGTGANPTRIGLELVGRENGQKAVKLSHSSASTGTAAFSPDVEDSVCIEQRI